MIGLVTNDVRIVDVGDESSLTFDCTGLAAARAVTDAGHEPNGYFWEGLIQYLDPELVDLLELDSEGDMFAAYAGREVLERLAALIAPYLDDGGRVAEVIAEAEASGFEFDD